MPVVEFTIGHKQYELSAQEGEERLLKRAAAMLDTEARTILEQAGRMPEQRLLLLAGLMLATTLWSGVQAVNAEARASYAIAADRLGTGALPGVGMGSSAAPDTSGISGPGGLQNGVGAAVKTMHSSHALAEDTVGQSAQVEQALEHILDAVGLIVDQNQQIAAAAEQQTAVAHDIDRNIVAINEAGQRTAEGAGHTEQASRELTQLVGHLQQLIAAFRV